MGEKGPPGPPGLLGFSGRSGDDGKSGVTGEHGPEVNPGSGHGGYCHTIKLSVCTPCA